MAMSSARYTQTHSACPAAGSPVAGAVRCTRLRPPLRAAHSRTKAAAQQQQQQQLVLTAPEQELLAAVESLGYPASIFPGDEPARARIDATIERLEGATPVPSPLRQGPGGQPSPLLLGDWKLIYASSGTYVTRTRGAQALLAASALPGVGVADIQQALLLAGSDGAASSSGGGGSGGGGGAEQRAPGLRTSNAAVFGLGPLGDWEVEIQGRWDVQDGQLARVTFDGFTLQLVGLLGALKLPRMAKVSVPVPNGRAADFWTTYLSDGLRVARGKSRNIFLFSRL